MIAIFFRNLFRYKIFGDTLGQRIDTSQVVQHFELEANLFNVASLGDTKSL